MGSVPHLYTTGDNDPEIEPVRYYRHYLYCDGCGSFELESWQKEGSEVIEARRKRLATAALYASALVIVPIWHLIGFVVSLWSLLLLVYAVTAVLLFWGVLRKPSRRPGGAFSDPWRFLGKTLLWVLIIGAVELSTEDLSPWALLTPGAVVVGGLLAWRAALGSGLDSLGKRCAGCGATYALGTPFFTDLDANPRGLTVADVPRPLGVSPFEEGAYVGADSATDEQCRPSE